MSIFAKAAKKASTKKSGAKGAPKKQTIWSCGDPSGDIVAKAVHTVVELKAEVKALEAKMGVHKTLLLKYAKDEYYSDYAVNGVAPETPMKIQNHDGESVTFVVQERNQYGVKDESVDALTQILGEDGAAELVYEETSFGFDRGLLAREGVMEVLGVHIEAAMEALVAAELCTEEEAEDLLDVKVKRSFMPGVLQRLGMIAGRNAGKMRQVCEALGSTCVQYIKA